MADARMPSPSLPEHQRHVYVIGQKALEEEMAALDLVWHGGTVSINDLLYKAFSLSPDSLIPFK